MLERFILDQLWKIHFYFMEEVVRRAKRGQHMNPIWELQDLKHSTFLTVFVAFQFTYDRELVICPAIGLVALRRHFVIFIVVPIGDWRDSKYGLIWSNQIISNLFLDNWNVKCALMDVISCFNCTLLCPTVCESQTGSRWITHSWDQ